METDHQSPYRDRFGIAYACRACCSELEKGANAAATLVSTTGDTQRSVGLTPYDVSVVVKTVSGYFLLKVATGSFMRAKKVLTTRAMHPPETPALGETGDTAKNYQTREVWWHNTDSCSHLLEEKRRRCVPSQYPRCFFLTSSWIAIAKLLKCYDDSVTDHFGWQASTEPGGHCN